jgi:uncharacterized protein (UPF0335 family)
MDPVSLLLVAQSSFAAIKAGVAAGKEIQSLFSDVFSLMDSLGAATRIAAQPPRGGLFDDKTPEQQAIEAYQARSEIATMYEEVKNLFISEHGIGAWDSILKDITRIRKERIAAQLQAEQEAAERLQIILFALPLIAIPLAIFVIIIIAIMRN